MHIEPEPSFLSDIDYCITASRRQPLTTCSACLYTLAYMSNAVHTLLCRNELMISQTLEIAKMRKHFPNTIDKKEIVN